MIGLYRVLAWITGTLLLILVFVGLPLKYLGDVPASPQSRGYILRLRRGGAHPR